MTAWDWDRAIAFGIGTLGLAPDLFWELTPHELNIMIDGYNRKTEERSRELRFLFADTIAVPIINFCRNSKHGTTTKRLLGPDFFRSEKDKANIKAEAVQLRSSFAHIFDDFKEPAPNV